MPDSPKVFDVVILGGGSGGYACALRSAQLGKSVALVERGKLGGTCLHEGCIPTKALLHAAELADAARAGSAHGIKSTFDGVDMAGVNSYKDSVVDRLYNGLQGLVKAGGITIVAGAGHLVDPTTVEVDGIRYHGTDLVLATGSYPRTLPGVELGGRVITSDDALRLESVPASVVIIGGSVIGVEFASVWRSFGANVTIVEALRSLVPLEDPALGKLLEREFRKRGIGFKTKASVRGVEQSGSEVAVTLDGGDTLKAELVLMAVGRGPASAGIGIEEARITVDRGWVATDDRLRTTVPHVYAVGDLVRGLQLAHRAFAHGIFVAEQIAGLQPEPIEDLNVPRITYCDPEIVSVGMTEPEAREEYGDVLTHEYNLGGNGRSQILGTSGIVKLVREKDGPIRGIHMIGARISEQVGEASLLVNWEAMPDDVARFIHAHPTQNEALGEASLALAGKPLHAHG